MCRNGLEPLPRHGSPGAGGTASSTLWAQEPCDPAPASPLAKSTAVGRTPGSGGPWAALPVYSVMVLTERANAACTASFSSSHFYRHLPRGSEGVCCATRLLLSSPPTRHPAALPELAWASLELWDVASASRSPRGLEASRTPMHGRSACFPAPGVLTATALGIQPPRVVCWPCSRRRVAKGTLTSGLSPCLPSFQGI